MPRARGEGNGEVLVKVDRVSVNKFWRSNVKRKALSHRASPQTEAVFIQQGARE